MNTRAQALPYEHLRRTEHWHIYTFPGGGGGSAGGVEVSDNLGEQGGALGLALLAAQFRGGTQLFFHAPAAHKVLCSFVSLLKWYPSPTRPISREPPGKPASFDFFSAVP
jgi:hypothetical protein